MAIQNWSDDIVVAEIADDPQFTEEMSTLADLLGQRPANVVVNLSGLGFLNSSNIARLLRLRKQSLAAGRRLILCAANNQVWGVFLVTGLDKIFEFTSDVATALATMQLSAERRPAK
jgi:anti-anti-sigma factor